MPLGDYLVGLLLFSITVTAVGTGAVLATGGRPPSSRIYGPIMIGIWAAAVIAFFVQARKIVRDSKA